MEPPPPPPPRPPVFLMVYCPCCRLKLRVARRLQGKWIPIIYWTGREVGWELINSPNNKNTFHTFSKTYMRLINEMKRGRKFDLAQEDASDAMEPIDIKLLERLRKKHDL